MRTVALRLHLAPILIPDQTGSLLLAGDAFLKHPAVGPLTEAGPVVRIFSLVDSEPFSENRDSCGPSLVRETDSTPVEGSEM